MSGRGKPIRIATRGSVLARRQAQSVAAALEQRRYEVELVEVETTGDQLRDDLIHRLGKTGAFVRSLDERVLDGSVHAAVHSMKDVPTEVPEGLIFAAVPERASPGDLLVSPGGGGLEELPAEAIVGTASLRRRAQLLASRPDLVVEPIRGNVDTRIEKLLAPSLRRELKRRRDRAEATEGDETDADGNGEAENDLEDDRTPDQWIDSLQPIERRALDRDATEPYDAIVLAAAGLERTDLIDQVGTSQLPTSKFVPAPGQGALAVTMLDTDLALDVHDVLDHPRSRAEVTVERTILARLGGGCVAPLGVHAVTQGQYVHTAVQVLDRSGEDVIAATRDLPVGGYREAAADFADDLAGRGARELIDEATADAGRLSE